MSATGIKIHPNTAPTNTLRQKIAPNSNSTNILFLYTVFPVAQYPKTK